MMLQGKWALISGASRGIGKATARLFAKHGAKLFLCARNEAPLEAFVQELQKEGVEAYGFAFDVADANATKETFMQIRKITKQLDIVVNAAGVMDVAMLGMQKPEQAEELFRINTLSSFSINQFASKMMLRHKSGSIINFSSVMAHKAFVGHSLYSASKAAIEAQTRVLAKELGAYNIRINAIAPGVVQTDMTAGMQERDKERFCEQIALGRFATPEEIAEVALFLASDMSRYITGAVLPVDGGMV